MDTDKLPPNLDDSSVIENKQELLQSWLATQLEQTDMQSLITEASNAPAPPVSEATESSSLTDKDSHRVRQAPPSAPVPVRATNNIPNEEIETFKKTLASCVTWLKWPYKEHATRSLQQLKQQLSRQPELSKAHLDPTTQTTALHWVLNKRNQLERDNLLEGNNTLEIARLLIQHGADILAPDAQGLRPLEMAAPKNNFALTYPLLDLEFRISAANSTVTDNFNSEIRAAAALGRIHHFITRLNTQRPDRLQELKDRLKSTNDHTTDSKGLNAVHWAVLGALSQTGVDAASFEKILTTLEQLGYSGDLQAISGSTPALLAVNSASPHAQTVYQILCETFTSIETSTKLDHSTLKTAAELACARDEKGWDQSAPCMSTKAPYSPSHTVEPTPTPGYKSSGTPTPVVTVATARYR